MKYITTISAIIERPLMQEHNSFSDAAVYLAGHIIADMEEGLAKVDHNTVAEAFESLGAGGGVIPLPNGDVAALMAVCTS